MMSVEFQGGEINITYLLMAFWRHMKNPGAMTDQPCLTRRSDAASA
jgi:hypothetical protein